eukprot:c44748_g1_i1.p1 GENE.c44748_g1_i1~~c44748_g1_i1.p1  ORF type:complete len:113 (+),score=5.27 c44748_g1_i1:40-339(+)
MMEDDDDEVDGLKKALEEENKECEIKKIVAKNELLKIQRNYENLLITKLNITAEMSNLKKEELKLTLMKERLELKIINDEKKLNDITLSTIDISNDELQ